MFSVEGVCTGSFMKVIKSVHTETAMLSNFN